ncbi:MAG: CPBP family intramembrane glutamic endopeptidase [bacterium]|jgi:hypothetical protein|nr:CPBP family intramembrane glutamic endopeptidase [bacterium]
MKRLIERLNHLLEKYYQRSRAQSTRRLITELIILSFLLKLIPAIAVGLTGIDPDTLQSTTDVNAQEGIAFLFVAAVLVSPPVETIFGQWFLLWLTSWFTSRRLWLLLIPATLFAAMHVYAGWINFFFVFPPSLIFTWCFMVNREHSRWKAVWTTTFVHFVHNAVAVGLYLTNPF